MPAQQNDRTPTSGIRLPLADLWSTSPRSSRQVFQFKMCPVHTYSISQSSFLPVSRRLSRRKLPVPLIRRNHWDSQPIYTQETGNPRTKTGRTRGERLGTL